MMGEMKMIQQVRTEDLDDYERPKVKGVNRLTFDNGFQALRENQDLELSLSIFQLVLEKYGCVASGLACGLILFRLGNYGDALPHLLFAAQNSTQPSAVGVAHFRLAHICDIGGEPGLALYHLEIAAKNEVLEAQYKLGEHFLHKENQFEKAVDLIHAAASGGFVPAQRKLGELFRHGNEHLEPKTRISFSYYIAAAKQGDFKSWGELCQMGDQGFGVQKTYRLSRYLHTQSASYGNADSLCWLHNRCVQIGCACVSKDGMLRAAARLGNVEAIARLGIKLLVNGKDCEISEALGWLFRGANLGIFRCMSDYIWSTKAKLVLGLALVLLKY